MTQRGEVDIVGIVPHGNSVCGAFGKRALRFACFAGLKARTTKAMQKIDCHSARGALRNDSGGIDCHDARRTSPMSTGIKARTTKAFLKARSTKSSLKARTTNASLKARSTKASLTARTTNASKLIT
jgi:hypothetical protein